jgi:Ribosomal protein S13/S18
MASVKSCVSPFDHKPTEVFMNLTFRYALTEIKGVGRRYANLVCKKADVDLKKRCVLVLLRIIIGRT